MAGLNGAASENTTPGGHVYLAGAIEYAPDNGKRWRQEVSQFIELEIGLSVFNPCINEQDLLSREEKCGFRDWKCSDRRRFLPVIRRIIDHDLSQLLNQTRFVVCLWDEHVTKGAGTAGELTAAYMHGIPVYLVCAIPLHSVSSWILGCASEVFETMDDLRVFLRMQYCPGAAEELAQ